MHHRARSLRPLHAASVLAIAAALMLSGCDDETKPDFVSGSDGGPRSSENAPEQEPTAEPSSEEAESPTSDLTGAVCLPGNWFVDNAEFGALMSTVSGSAVDNIKGSVMVTFRDDGTTTTHYDEWTHTITMDSATVTILKNGKDSGTYEVAADGSMTLTDTDISSTTTSRMEMGGQTVNNTAPPQPSVFSQATFTCKGDELTVSAEGATTVLHREH